MGRKKSASISRSEAIRRCDDGKMTASEVVAAVKSQFGLETTSALVYQVRQTSKPKKAATKAPAKKTASGGEFMDQLKTLKQTIGADNVKKLVDMA